MQESPQLQEEKGLERRAWLGCLLAFALAGVIMGVVITLPHSLFPVQPTGPAWLVFLSALLPLIVTLVIGIAGVVLVFRLMNWSTEGERRRRQRSTAVLKQTLPGLGLGQLAPTSAPLISSRQLARFLLLFMLYVVIVVLLAVVVSAIVEYALPGMPGIVTTILTTALSLGVLYLGEQAVHRSRRKAGSAVASSARPQAQDAKPAGSRAAAMALYFVLMLVPLMGIITLLVRIPVPPPLIPVLALGVCTVVFMAMSAIYIIAPFLWIASAVKRCDYDRAIARARQIEKLSILPGFYLNMHGVILLWAGKYEEARSTFEQSIGEQRKEVMGAGSGALENIGCVLAWQGQYDEAIKMFEGSITISPDQVMVYSDLAEALLYQGADLPRALELTERAWKNNQASRESRWLSPQQGGQILANRAWALARLGRYQEAEETLSRAFAVADQSFKPVLSGIYLRAGYVALARADDGRAKEYFRRGQQLDPNGHYGRLCKSMEPGSNT